MPHDDAAPGGRFESGTFSGPSGSRSYRLYVPEELPQRPALVVMLHGCTQDAADFAAGTRMDEHARVRGFLALYPEQTSEHHPQKCWQWYDEAHQRADAGEPALLAAMVRRVAEERGADPERVYLAGISAGGSMAWVLAVTHPGLFAKVAVHSAVPYGVATDVNGALAALQAGAGDPSRAVERIVAAAAGAPRLPPALVLHGAADPVVRPINGDEGACLWAEAMGGADGSRALVRREDELEEGGRRVRRVRWAAADGAVAVEGWRIEGLGHAWSGGSPDGSYTDPEGPDATARIVEFFLGGESR